MPSKREKKTKTTTTAIPTGKNKTKTRDDSTYKKSQKTNCRKLYENYLAGDKSDYFVSLDEAVFYRTTNFTTHEPTFCYSKDTNLGDNFFLKHHGYYYATQVLVVAAMSKRGALPLITLRFETNVTKKYFINHVLKPLLEQQLKELYSKEELKKVVVYYHPASKPSARFTEEYAGVLRANTGVRILSNTDVQVKSRGREGSPLDFFGFPYLKTKLNRSRATTIPGIRKVLHDEWSKVSPEKCEEVFTSWKRKLRAAAEKRVRASHNEETENIHPNINVH